MIYFSCPICKCVLQGSDGERGNKINCLKCGQRLQIPAPVQNKTILAVSVPFASTEKSPHCEIRKRPAKKVKHPDARIMGEVSTNALVNSATMYSEEKKDRRLRRKTAVIAFGIVGLMVCGLIILLALICADIEKPTAERTAQQRPIFPSSTNRLRPHRSPVTQDQDPLQALPGNSPSRHGASPRINSQPADPPLVIQLSGVHRPSAGILTVQDRSNLDLWMDNPVEADAMWKDKIVELEMSINDLHVVKSNGGLAALETPNEGPWGMQHGWQRAGFIFSGDNSKQLIGFQNQSGIIVIEGICKGLRHGCVVFDDCRIAKKPKSDPVFTGKKTPPVQFDLSDFDRTIKWAIMESERLSKDADNRIRFAASLRKFNDEAHFFVGKKVRWTLQVSSINENYVRLLNTYGSRSSDGIFALMALTGPHLKLEDADGITEQPRDNLEAPVPRKRPSGDEFALVVGHGITMEKAERLNPGNLITITAELVDVSMQAGVYSQSSAGGIHVKVTLKELSAK